MKIVGLLLATLVCGTISAQTPPFEDVKREYGLHGQQLKDFLQLSDEQIDGIERLNLSSREALRPMLREMGRKKKELRDAIEEELPNSSYVGQLIVDLKESREQLHERKAESRSQALALLTPSQIQTLESLKRAIELGPAVRQAVGMNLLEGPKRFGPKPSRPDRLRSGMDRGRRGPPFGRNADRGQRGSPSGRNADRGQRPPPSGRSFENRRPRVR